MSAKKPGHSDFRQMYVRGALKKYMPGIQIYSSEPQTLFILFEDFKDAAFTDLCSRRSKYRSHSAGCLSLFSNHLPEVAGCYPEFKNSRPFAVNLVTFSVVIAKGTSLTLTSSGLSTSALAIASTNSLILVHLHWDIARL